MRISYCDFPRWPASSLLRHNSQTTNITIHTNGFSQDEKHIIAGKYIIWVLCTCTYSLPGLGSGHLFAFSGTLIAIMKQTDINYRDADHVRLTGGRTLRRYIPCSPAKESEFPGRRGTWPFNMNFPSSTTHHRSVPRPSTRTDWRWRATDRVLDWGIIIQLAKRLTRKMDSR